MNCRSCGRATTEIFSLGDQYLSDFRVDDSKTKKYPLTLMRCHECTLVQLSNSAPSAEMYHERYSFKSGISDAIAKDLSNIVQNTLLNHPTAKSWLDIASNDGTLLGFVPENIFRVGIDPLKQFAEEAATKADSIITDFFKADYFIQTFDVISSVSMFYDLDNPNEFVAGVKAILANSGVWVIQQNYIVDMLKNNSFDNISHEHLAYYSMQSMKYLLDKHNLEIFSMSRSSINGGCFRVFVGHKGQHGVPPYINRYYGFEAKILDDRSIESFAHRVETALDNIRGLVNAINTEDNQVWVYGASTRGGTIWQAAGLDVKDLPFVVDRNPAKHNKYMTSIGAPIISEEQMRTNPPEYLLVGPWWFKNEFLLRENKFLVNGGRMIFPLPELEIV